MSSSPLPPVSRMMVIRRAAVSFLIVALLSFVILAAVVRAEISRPATSPPPRAPVASAIRRQQLSATAFLGQGPWTYEGDPLTGGTEVSLGPAVTDLGASLPRPQVDAANDGNLGQVWIESVKNDFGAPYDVVALKYPQDKIVLYYQPAPWAADASSHFQAIAAELQAKTSLGTIAGNPELTITQNTDVTGGNPSSVTTVVNGHSLTLMGFVDPGVLVSAITSALQTPAVSNQ